MLKLHFINVGDGDAILVELCRKAGIYRMLIDAGRPGIRPRRDSLRQPAACYLKELGITRLDAVVITHLHIDHFGGLGAILEDVQIDCVYSGYFPGAVTRTLSAEGLPTKSQRGLVDCLNTWAGQIHTLRQRGARLVEVTEDIEWMPAEGLSVRLIAPRRELMTLQKETWDALYRGQIPPDGPFYRSAKARNPASLRVRLSYGGRLMELSGDCYGEEWEHKAQGPCDLWKIPHHADAKSVTEGLVRTMAPSIAVVSCGAEYIPHKDRPSNRVHGWLTQAGAQVLYTDSYPAGGEAPRYHTAILICITADGQMIHETRSEIRKTVEVTL